MILKLKIIKEEKFYGQNGNPVYRIWASSPHGTLIKTVDIDDKLYVGALYDGEWNMIYSSEESGEEFYPNASFKRNYVNKVRPEVKKTVEPEKKQPVVDNKEVESESKEPKSVKLKNGLEVYTMDID